MRSVLLDGGRSDLEDARLRLARVAALPSVKGPPTPRGLKRLRMGMGAVRERKPNDHTVAAAEEVDFQRIWELAEDAFWTYHADLLAAGRVQRAHEEFAAWDKVVVESGRGADWWVLPSPDAARPYQARPPLPDDEIASLQSDLKDMVRAAAAKANKNGAIEVLLEDVFSYHKQKYLHGPWWTTDADLDIWREDVQAAVWANTAFLEEAHAEWGGGAIAPFSRTGGSSKVLPVVPTLTRNHAVVESAKTGLRRVRPVNALALLLVETGRPLAAMANGLIAQSPVHHFVSLPQIGARTDKIHSGGRRAYKGDAPTYDAQFSEGLVPAVEIALAEAVAEAVPALRPHLATALRAIQLEQEAVIVSPWGWFNQVGLPSGSIWTSAVGKWLSARGHVRGWQKQKGISWEQAIQDWLSGALEASSFSDDNQGPEEQMAAFGEEMSRVRIPFVPEPGPVMLSSIEGEMLFARALGGCLRKEDKYVSSIEGDVLLARWAKGVLPRAIACGREGQRLLRFARLALPRVSSVMLDNEWLNRQLAGQQRGGAFPGTADAMMGEEDEKNTPRFEATTKNGPQARARLRAFNAEWVKDATVTEGMAAKLAYLRMHGR